MKVGHDDEAKYAGDDTPKLDFIVARHAGGKKVIGDLAMKNYHSGTCR